MRTAPAFAHTYITGPALQREPVQDFVRVKVQSLQEVTPSLHPEISDGESTVSYTTEDRTFAGNKAPIDEISERDFARIISNTLQAHYGRMKSSAKCIANDCGASVPSAKNWLAGVVVPSAVFLKRLERKVPGLAAEMRRLTAMEGDSDPEFQRQLSEFIHRVQALGG